MAFADYLTAEGERLLAKSIADSVPIVFTKVAMGSGYLPQGVSEKNVSELVTEETTVDVTTVSLNDSSSVVVTAYFNNEALTDGFYFREKGIYMRVGEDEALGIYGNAGSTAEYIDTTDECVIEKVLRTIIQMSSDELKNVQLWNGTAAVAPLIIKDMTLSEFVETDTALTVIAGQQLVIDKTIYVFTGGDQRDIANYTKGVQLSDVYDKQIEGADENGGIGASQNAVYFVHREVEEHTNDTDNPHNVTKEQVGLGNVPNVSTNDQAPTYTEASALEALKSGEKLSVAFGKIAKAIKDFISHIATKATTSTQGHVKLSNSSSVTDSTGLALAATEKNASISGTLANQITTHTHHFLEVGVAYKDYDIQLPTGYSANTVWAWSTQEALACTMVYTSSQATEPCVCMIDNEYAVDQAAMIRIQTTSGAPSANGGDYRVRLWYVVK